MPEQNRQRLQLDDSLFARGMSGTSGGAEQNRAFQEAANQADLQRQLAGQDFAMQQQNHLYNLGSNAMQNAGGLGMDRFNLAGNMLQMADTRRQNMLGNGMNAMQMYQQMFNPLLQLGQMGVQAGGAQATGAGIAADAVNHQYTTYGNIAKVLLPPISNRVFGGIGGTPTNSAYGSYMPSGGYNA